MIGLETWIAAHPLEMFVAYWIYMALADSLPEPLPAERWYNGIYKFLHLLAGNLISKVLPKKP